ncbi:MAG: T9SS type A sorting domain-containing protein [Bacteroidota bacterium]
MRKALQTILLALIASTGFAQIQNSGFENWTTMGIYENPQSWGTMNNATAATSIFTATKGSPGNPGSFYLKLTSKLIGISVLNGIAVSGILDSITQTPKSGFPFTLRPQSFGGKWQHMIYGSSQGSVSVLLTRWNTALSVRETVATASQTLTGMVMSWGNFNINFVYQSGEFPDTCIIVLKASGSNPAQNDYLWVDNLAFSGSVAGISENNVQSMVVNSYPNPANEEIGFACTTTFQQGDRIIISDMLGNIMEEKSISGTAFKINTSEFANGNYIYYLVNKLNIQYSNGKFSVQH